MQTRSNREAYILSTRRNRLIQNEFLSGERLDGLYRLMGTKWHCVRTAKSYTTKSLIEIGLNTLKVKDIVFGKTANGYDKATVVLYKSPKTEACLTKNGEDINYTVETYDTISCTHVLQQRTTGDFSKEWFKPFSKGFRKEDFEQLKKNTLYKCVVLQKEELFVMNGKQMVYEQGNKMGKPIVLIRPQVIEVYDIDTPDENIKFDYKKLYQPIK